MGIGCCHEGRAVSGGHEAIGNGIKNWSERHRLGSQMKLSGRSTYKQHSFPLGPLGRALPLQGLPVTTAAWACEPQTRLPLKYTLESMLLPMLTIEASCKALLK